MTRRRPGRKPKLRLSDEERIFQLRERGLKIQDISDLTGWSTATVHRVLTGQTRPGGRESYEQMRADQKLRQKFAFIEAKQKLRREREQQNAGSDST